MFTKFIDTYGDIKNNRQIPDTDLNAIKESLPEGLFDLIQNGEGSYMNGFFWIVNPIEYREVIAEIYIPLKGPSICFARDAFGSLYVWEDNTVYLVDLRAHTWKVVGRKPAILFDGIMTDWGYFSKQVNAALYEEAKKSLGELSYDECYGYTPLIGMGGLEKVENLKKVKIKEYISIVAQALGPIE